MNDNIGNELADRLFERLKLDYIDNDFSLKIKRMYFERGTSINDSYYLSACAWIWKNNRSAISADDGESTVCCAHYIKLEEYNDPSYVMKQANDFYNNIYSKLAEEGITYSKYH